MRFGLVMNERGLKNSGRTKRLTYEPKGLTNNTVVKLDGREYWFGERPFRREDGKPTFTGPPWPGHWRDQKKALGKDPTGRQRNGYESVWEYEKQHVTVTQTVEIVPGPQTNLLDTCLVHYRITNEDTTAPHRVGLRFMLDTYIGANDGVPFVIPGQPGLLTKFQDFGEKQIPDYIEALERPDLKDPGTVAHLGLKGLHLPGLELEPIHRMLICRWTSSEQRWEPEAKLSIQTQFVTRAVM